MTFRKTTPAHTVGMPTLRGTMRAAFSALPNPVAYLRAYQDLHHFRSMDAERLRDAGLTQQDAARANLGDFLKRPGRAFQMPHQLGFEHPQR